MGERERESEWVRERERERESGRGLLTGGGVIHEPEAGEASYNTGI